MTFKAFTFSFALSAMLALGACASTEPTGDYADLDPLEETNRAVLAFNEGLDKAVLEPVAEGYRAATPSGIRIAIRNFLRNLRSPIDLGNQVLQGDVEGSTNQVFRTFVNTTAGFGGVVDVAEMGGIPYEREDFGQTLGTWGIGHGAYVVLPFFGPSSIRDGVGEAVDGFADPLRLYLFNIEREGLHYVRFGAAVVDTREQLLDILDDLRRNSFDYYAALRSAYLQNREAVVNDKSSELLGAEIPDYEDF